MGINTHTHIRERFSPTHAVLIFPLTGNHYWKENFGKQKKSVLACKWTMLLAQNSATSIYTSSPTFQHNRD